MSQFGSWILDERKFLNGSELGRVRKSVRARVERAGFKKRLPWLEWFLIELGLETGLRVAEIAGLTCSDLVFTDSVCGVMVRHGKGDKPRFVRVRRSFARVCEDFLNWKQAVGESIMPDAPVFLSAATNGHMTTRALQKMFSRVCQRVQVCEHSIHHLRHTYASHLYKSSGKDLRLVQRQLGHSSIRTTEVYAHVFDRDLERAVERLYA